MSLACDGNEDTFLNTSSCFYIIASLQSPSDVVTDWPSDGVWEHREVSSLGKHQISW